ncbi:MAG: cyclic nucleotide-binding protein [Proteobacteria bacterium]|nr:cyclic nucleotide-binding protein [Pseudomonadota bacterium]
MLKVDNESLYDKYELFGCIQCGKCTGGCPVSLNSPLNIRRLMHEALVREDLECIYGKEELWACSSCKTCTIRCPRELRPADLIIGMRTALIEEGHIPKTIIDALESAYKYGNPWGAMKNKRSEWAEDLDLKVLSQGGQAANIYFICCTAAYDTRVQNVARSMVTCFRQVGLDFTTLGDEEICCGSEIRRIGEEGLFEMLLEQNRESIKKHNVHSIVTTSPHCYNAFKNDYGEDSLEVRHYTQVLIEAIEKNNPFARETKQVITYHDPCFLGKQNGIFEEPRNILKAIPGVTFIDFDRSREKSLCCEGGGGRMWVEASDQGPRSAEIRIKDAVEMGANILATACPFCLLTLEDAVKTTGNEEKLRVMDISEILVEALDRE